MVIKKKLQLNYTEAIYVFAGNTLLQADQTLFNVYEKYAKEDKFLHLQYCEYATFGK
jgi:GABA(A) receptor-associated protein